MSPSRVGASSRDGIALDLPPRRARRARRWAAATVAAIGALLTVIACPVVSSRAGHPDVQRGPLPDRFSGAVTAGARDRDARFSSFEDATKAFAAAEVHGCSRSLNGLAVGDTSVVENARSRRQRGA